MLLETALAFCVGTFAIFVGAVITIVRIMVNRLIRQHDKELKRAYERGATAALTEWQRSMERERPTDA